MENKMTAIEWLYDEIKHIIPNDFLIKFEQAKAMEKEKAKTMYTEEEVYDLLVEWDMYQKGEPRVDEDEIPNGFMSFNEWFKEISKQQDDGKD